MKFRAWIGNTVAFLSVVLFISIDVAAQDDAAQNFHHRHHHRHYKLFKVGTFGGFGSYLGLPPSRVLTINGSLVGFADTNIEENLVASLCAPDICYVQQSFTWHDRKLTRLPSLVNGVSNLTYWANDRGWVAGGSETGTLAPNGFPDVAPVIWRDAQITNLGTLGGTAGFTNALNNRGEAVGISSNGVSGDPFSMLQFGGAAPNDTQGRAFRWKNGSIFDLGTLGGADSSAVYINDRGQIAGISYVDSVPIPALGNTPAIATFVWEKGEMKNIGGFGGHYTQPVALNQRGEIAAISALEGDQTFRSFIYKNGFLKDMGDLGGQNVYVHTINDYGVATGYSDIPAGTPVFGHPFIWKNGHMIDLGAPPANYYCAAGDSVNIRDQVVGNAGCTNTGIGFAFFWEPGGSIVNLNALVAPKSTFRIYHAFAINDRGEIACEGALPTGEDRACLLVPVDDDEWCDKDDEVIASAENSTAAATQSNPRANAALERQMVRDQMMKSSQKGSSRYHMPTQRDAPSK